MTAFDIYKITDEYPGTGMDAIEVVINFFNEELRENNDFNERVEYAANMDARQLIVFHEVYKLEEDGEGDGDELIYRHEQLLDTFKIYQKNKIAKIEDVNKNSDFAECIEKRIELSEKGLLEITESGAGSELIWYLVTELKTGIQEADWGLRFA